MITIISREFSLEGKEDKMKCFCFQHDRLDGLSVPAGTEIYLYICIYFSPPYSTLSQTLKARVKILIRNVGRRRGNQGWGRGRGKCELCLQVCFPSAFSEHDKANGG